MIYTCVTRKSQSLRLLFRLIGVRIIDFKDICIKIFIDY